MSEFGTSKGRRCEHFIVGFSFIFLLFSALVSAQLRFNDWAFADGSAPHPDLRYAVYSGAIISAKDDSPFNFLLNRLLTEPLQSEQVVIARALAMSTEHYQLQFLLDQCLTDNIRDQVRVCRPRSL